ncbi:MAG TPA: YkgJ family cysteine cluster protein [Candidatus Omnitrophota bacterium]|nr:YkgJ family cysteine cluster protein [Candidatus Omnitrophota bacterium]HPS21008.1 YkgJ family cysteine cluster protein [Candidatus Omnitrophota bacterium]
MSSLIKIITTAAYRIMFFIRNRRVLVAIGVSDRKTVRKIIGIFGEIDRKISLFCAVSGTKCPPNCGECCLNPGVEAMVTELLPLAVHLWSNGTAIAALEKLETRGFRGPCVFYNATSPDGANGRCSVYPLRPSICRLFGFSASTDKEGKTVFASCYKMKALYPEDHKRALSLVDKGLKVPHINDFSVRIAGLVPGSGAWQYPINEAARIAIEKVGLAIRLGRK